VSLVDVSAAFLAFAALVLLVVFGMLLMLFAGPGGVWQ
jgi:hypothetical protein